MKKTVIIIAIVFIIASCSAKDISKAEKAANNAFKSNIELTWCGKKYTGEIKRNSSESIEISVIGEELSSPILYSMENGGLTTKTENLELTVPYRDAMPDSLIVTIYESFLLLPNAEIAYKKEMIYFTLPKAVIVYDNETDSLSKIQMKDGELKFIEFEYL